MKNFGRHSEEVTEHSVSPLAKTWLFDLDGTILKHNGYATDGFDTLMPGAFDFLASLSQKDTIIFLTSRKKKFRGETERFLRENGIRFTTIIFELPFGERILVNDCKPSGLKTALAINTQRDVFMPDTFTIDADL